MFKQLMSFLVIAGFVLAMAPAAQAAFISTTTATARSEFDFHAGWHHRIEAAVNGDGMVSGEGATGLHTAANGNTGLGWQVDQAGNIAHWVKVDLGASYDVGNMYVWNSWGELWERGIKTVDIYYSTTDPGNNTHEDLTDFDTTGWTLWDGGGTAVAQTVNPGNTDFLPTDTIALDVNAQYIVLNITEGYGGINNVRIGELQFDGELAGGGGSAVPEPATATLALLGLGGLMMRRRRQA